MKEKNNLDSLEPLCISIPAAGRLLGVSRPTAYAMVRMKQLPAIRCGQRRLVVPVAALRRMLESADDGQHPDLVESRESAGSEARKKQTA